MYSIIPFILVIVSLGVIVFIIVRHYPQVTLLDVNSIPEVQMEKKKIELLKKRLEKDTLEADKKWKKMWVPVKQQLKDFQLWFRKYVGRVHTKVLEHSVEKKRDVNISPEELKQDLHNLLQSGEMAFNQKNFDLAESKYIEAIKLDPKNIEAYYGLGLVYMQKEVIDEAREAFEFILKLDENNEQAIVRLAEIARLKGDKEKAIEYYDRSILLDDTKATRFVAIAELAEELGRSDLSLEAIRQAVDLEPQNPKYLDMLIESSVKCGNKELASKAYQELRMVNPENNKLVILKDKIDKMPN